MIEESWSISMTLQNNTPLTRAHHLQTKISVCSLFLLAQAGEDLVPEQKDEREEAEKRDASVLHSIPPVLMREGAKRSRYHFKVKHKL